jgi:ankyrin repeat protein
MSLTRSSGLRFLVGLAVFGFAPVCGDARAQDTQIDRLLVEECRRGNAEKVAELLKQGANPKAESRGGITALHQAASRGHVEVMRLLIDRGADVNAKDVHGRTPMGEAVGNHDPAAVKALLSAKAKPDDFALGQAGWLGRIEAVNLLLDATWDPSTGIVRAAQGGHVKIVQLLLERGASVQAKSADGNTALHTGALQGGLETVQLLLRSKADPNVTNHEGRTPLHMAISGDGELKTIQLLVASGARLDIPDKELVTPVRLAAYRGDKTAYAWLLAANGGKEPEVAELVAEAKRMGAKTPQELIAALLSRNEDQIVAAEREMHRRGRKIMPELLQTIESGTPIEHFYDLFAAMGPSAEAALPRLESKLGDKRHVFSAAITIEHIKPGALDKLNDETSQKAQAALYEAIVDPDADVMASFCANILVRLGKPAKQTMLRLLGHAQTEPRRRMVSQLEAAQFDDAELAAALRNLTKVDQLASVRAAAAKTLGHFGAPTEEAKAALFAVIEHPPVERGDETEEAKMTPSRVGVARPMPLPDHWPDLGWKSSMT